jgi:hypothetical protein
MISFRLVAKMMRLLTISTFQAVVNLLKLLVQLSIKQVLCQVKLRLHGIESKVCTSTDIILQLLDINIYFR